MAPTPIQIIASEETKKRGIKLMVKRDDLVHPTIMGNKWRKLKYNLREARSVEAQSLLTFGGAYSNHIAATAAAAKEYGFQSIGIIRGDELNANSNPTLIAAAKNGMELVFKSRTTFNELKQDASTLKLEYPNAYVLPEGGTNGLAIEGAAEIIDEIDTDYDYMICPVGTGGTMAGLLRNLDDSIQLIGISSLKGDFIHKEFRTLIAKHKIDKTNYLINNDFHCGGYGKVTHELVRFINEFKKEHKIPLDPIYTGKMMLAVMEMIKNDHFESGANIIAIHTGGLQGIVGFNADKGDLIR